MCTSSKLLLYFPPILAVHPNGKVVATGQSKREGVIMGQAHIRFWHSRTLRALHVIGVNAFTTSAVCGGFSYAQNLLVAVTTTVSMVVKCEKRLPMYDLGVNNQECLVTAGEEHLVWWRIERETGRIVQNQKADYQRQLRPTYITCLSYNSRGDLITG